MDSLMVRTVMKMDAGEGELVLDAIKRVAIDLDLTTPDTVELVTKTALFRAVTEALGPQPEQDPESFKAQRRDGLVARLADYYGCTEQDVLKGIKDESVFQEPKSL